jgi:beta-xylosidase
MTTASDQFSPGELWLDDHGVHINAHGGGILYDGGLYYWFGEHKIDGEAGNLAMVGVHCYSSADLYHWKDEGIALAVSDDPKSDIVRGCSIERPKVIYNARTGKYVMWFHLEFRTAIQGYTTASSGIAVADRPAGPYQFLRTLRPNAGAWPQNVPDEMKKPLRAEEKEHLASLKSKMLGGWFPEYPKDLLYRRDHEVGQMARDQTLFLDDDGKGYHIHASEENGTLHISELTPDFLSTSGKYSRFFAGRFHEGPALMKRNGVYYMISSDCTGWTPNAARLATAPSIWGPWTELGNPCVGSPEELANTFESQSTYILPVAGKEDAYIYLGDRWRPKNAIDGRYIWLPLQFKGDVPFLEWKDRWDLSFFV